MKTHSINNLEFALSGQMLSGKAEPEQMPRLSDMLTTQTSSAQAVEIQYTLIGSAKKYSLPSLHLNVDATLPVTCQRCLNAMSVHLELEFDYLIAPTEPAEFDENDELDWLEISQNMSILDLIEDELLIAMPIAPTHSTEYLHECMQHNMQSGEKPNPFAVLKSLNKQSVQ